MVDVRDESATESADAPHELRGGGDAGDESGPGPDGIFAGVLASYGERGYERGYRRAVSDALAALLLATEEYVRDRPHDRTLRAVLYAFEEHVERELRRLGSKDGGFVTDGLGI
jgi:hypothetical protein